MIHPMMKAVRTNHLYDMMKYEDIMINLADVMLNHKRDMELTGRIQEAFKERQNTIAFKRNDTIESLVVELDSLGIFDSLNKAANHYKEYVIQEVNVTRDCKSKALISTFECSGGFIYARKGYLKIIRIERIKAFGDAWKAKLRELEAEGTYSTRTLAKMLGIDSKTVKKYLSSDIKNDNW